MSWTQSQIVAQVNKRTENRAADKIDVSMEFWLGLDEFVSEQHFWWRHKRFTFNSVVGGQVYDLSGTVSTVSGGVTVYPAGGLTDFAQWDELILLGSDGKSKQMTLTPIIDPVGQLTAINNNVADVPSAYFIDTNIPSPVSGNPTVFYLQAPSNVAQVMLGTYWAVPAIGFGLENDIDTIPLVPGYLHWGLIYVLERRIYEFLYGQDDPRWQVANSRYEEFCQKAARMPHWSGRRVREAGVSAVSMPAVRATGIRR